MTRAEKHIRRFNRLEGNSITRETLKEFHDAIKTDIESKRIDAHMPLGVECLDIEKRLAAALRKMNGHVHIVDRVHLVKTVDVEKVLALQKVNVEKKRKPKKKPTPPKVKKVKPSPKVKAKPKKRKPKRIMIVDDLPKVADLLHGLELNPAEAFEPGFGFTADGQKKIYDMVNGLILDTMKKDGLFWRKKWDRFQLPLARNFVSNKPYKGANFVILDMIGLGNVGYGSPYYLTFKQVKEQGGTVMKGADGWPVVFYSRIYKKDGEKITEEQYEAMTRDQQRKVTVIPFLQYYKVFNAQEIEGIEFPQFNKEIKARPEKEIIESAEKIVDGYTNRPPITHAGNAAHFQPGKDKITMPDKKAFATEQDYYSTLFHELVHSTGHESRLDREFSGDQDSKEYAFEELIAELGASYLCAEAGILYHTLNNSAVYIKHYSAKLKEAIAEDSKFFLKAAAAAQKAVDYILSRSEAERKAEPTKERAPVKREVKPVQTKAKNLSGINGLVGADQIASMSFEEIPLDGEWKQEFNRLMSDTQIMVWGLPGSGKTVKLLKFAQYLAQKGLPVLYVANEELGRSSFTEKIREFKIGHDNLRFAKTLPQDISAFKVVFLDSVQSMGMDLDKYKKFRELHPDKLTVAIIQSTKDGDFRGGKDWEHEVDIAGEVISRKMVMRKNRLDPDHEAKAESIKTEQLVKQKKKSQLIAQKVKKEIAPQPPIFQQ